MKHCTLLIFSSLLIIGGIFIPICWINQLFRNYTAQELPILILVGIWGLVGLIGSFKVFQKYLQIYARQTEHEAQFKAEADFNKQQVAILNATNQKI